MTNEAWLRQHSLAEGCWNLTVLTLSLTPWDVVSAQFRVNLNGRAPVRRMVMANSVRRQALLPALLSVFHSMLQVSNRRFALFGFLCGIASSRHVASFIPSLSFLRMSRRVTENT
eukprot:2112459-Rhodomonas_salina.1